jgi:inorganic pyrophosphatase
MTDEDNWAGMDVWQHAEAIVRGGRLVIDRPQGTAHPKFPEFVYPLDYGFIEETQGGDGEGIDVWVGTDPVERVTAIAATIDPFKRNAELKLFWRCTEEEIARVEGFYAPQPQAGLVMRRPG